MKKSLFITSALALSLIACDRNSPQAVSPDNTEVNVRDRGETQTPFDQSEKGADLTITKNIREKIVGERNLSTNGKNVKIITVDGRVTLRGPVKNEQEKSLILNDAQSVAGVKNVIDQLDIAP